MRTRDHNLAALRQRQGVAMCQLASQEHAYVGRIEEFE